MDDEGEIFVAEPAVSGSDNEEDSDNEEKHQQLLDTISSLDGKKRRRKLAERSEASVHVSEFGISSEGAGEKINLSDLIVPIKKTASLSAVKKQLNKLKEKKSVELPLSKEEAQKIQRIVSYKSTSEEVAKWDHIVKQNRRAEQLFFPLNDEALKPAPIGEMVTGWSKAATPLEMEIFSILHKNKQPITDPLLTPVEEASLKAMSLEEATLRRAELQKARALQSYYEAKARRERKIKSKKYHRLLKKSKQKEALKAFEELRKSNPEAALEELNKLERARMEERMSLKHQNSGKWAKSKAIMAKYDEEARKAMQEQLQQNKELTRKIEVLSESEESEKEEEIIPDFVNEAQMTLEGPNPWMTGKLRNDEKDLGVKEGEEELQIEAEVDTRTDEPEEDQESEEETLLKEFEDKRRLRKEEEQESLENEQRNSHLVIVEDLAAKQASEFSGVFHRLLEQNRIDKAAAGKSVVIEADEPEEGDAEELEVAVAEGPLMIASLERNQSLGAVEALGEQEFNDEEITQPETPRKKKPKNKVSQPEDHKQAKKPKLIDHNEILPVKARRVQTPLLPTTVEEEEETNIGNTEEDGETEQKMIIQEAFAGDDVISDFLKEKRAAEAAGKPKDISLVLPGWGEWGGTNVKVSKKKRQRFIIKAPPAPLRKDQRLPNVIISEKRNILAAAHQVNDLPFPFNSRHHFESSIRAPVGNTWNTERSVQKLTAPRVITKRGHIIEPITEDVFQKHSSAKQPAIKADKPKTESQPRPQKASNKRKGKVVTDRRR
ncbi:U3 small nucleolar RNA-associated protein 14 homolog A [Pseudophryne corroboree]|uniref:U3 small nucleolar RNA-associated protein 14 homolog A n=1 Tax=Pseudophryne corroboree TaxID=495146 RepID=UPI003081A0D8